MSQEDTQKEPKGKAKRLAPHAWSAIKNNMALAGALATLVVAVIGLSGIQELKQGIAGQETQNDTCQNIDEFETYRSKMEELFQPIGEAKKQGEGEDVRAKEQGEDAREKAQKCTRQILAPSLGAKDKGKVVEYLSDNGLIQKDLNPRDDEEHPIIELASEKNPASERNDTHECVSEVPADVRGADLGGADLQNTYLACVDLSGVKLSGTDLSGADLSGAILSAKLRGAALTGANLSDADLSSVNLSGADLSDAILSDDKGAKILRDRKGANLSGAILSGAALRNADLRSVDLNGATVTDEQLNTVWSREGATMPDGTLYSSSQALPVAPSSQAPPVIPQITIPSFSGREIERSDTT